MIAVCFIMHQVWLFFKWKKCLFYTGKFDDTAIEGDIYYFLGVGQIENQKACFWSHYHILLIKIFFIVLII